MKFRLLGMVMMSLVITGCSYGNIDMDSAVNNSNSEKIVVSDIDNTDNAEVILNETDNNKTEAEESAAVNNEEADIENIEDIDNNSYLQDCVVNGILGYRTNPEEYNRLSPCEIHFDQVIIKDGQSADVKEIVIPVKMTMMGEYTSDCMDYSFAVTPRLLLADKATGVIFQTQEANGSGDYSYGGNIINGSQEMKVSYKCEYYMAEGEWIAKEDEQFEKKLDFDITYTVNVPADYDGLVLCIVPLENYDDYMNEDNCQYINELPGSTISFDVVNN